MAEVQIRPVAGYGYIPDLHDIRDAKLEVDTGYGMPKLVDMRHNMPPIVDQGHLGSCTGNAIAGALGYDQIKQGEPLVPLSRLFIYYNERQMEGTVNVDSGAMIRDGIKSVNQVGACSEALWPYEINRFDQLPTTSCYAEALNHQAVAYTRVTSDTLRYSLATDFPVVIGFTVYESFESAEVASTGLMPMPVIGEQVMGGHAVLVVGYDDLKKVYIVRNSWGTGWGDSGYFYMPYDYVSTPGLVSDMWQIQKIE
jgi:C1A family cysteine protease